jgi:hypothetical protein
MHGGGDSDDGSNDEEEPSDNGSECKEDIDMDENLFNIQWKVEL